MTEPLISDRAVEFDGKIIGYIQFESISRGAANVYWADMPEMAGSKCFNTRESAVAWLVERYAKAQEGE